MGAQAAVVRSVVGMVMVLSAAGGARVARADEAEDLARVRRAIAYLDERQEAWAHFANAQRGEGSNATSCVSCHTGISYALSRPALSRLAGETAQAAPLQRMLSEVTLRTEHWDELDAPRYRLMYDSSDQKKAESRGTEAVLNALILARNEPPGRMATHRAFQHLWATQQKEGEGAGSWNWLNFGYEPWEADRGRVFGAALAAIAVGSAPGERDEAAARGIDLLRSYLRGQFANQNLYNRLWIAEASTVLSGLLSDDQTQQVVDQLTATRGIDGGWALASLGTFERRDGTPEPRESDGYATSLALHVLLRTGVANSRPEVAEGLAWLRKHQRADGSWPASSLNKQRDPASFTGKLMADAATAFAALVLVEADSK